MTGALTDPTSQSGDLRSLTVNTLRTGAPSPREVEVTENGNLGSETPAERDGQGRKAAPAGFGDLQSASDGTSGSEGEPAGDDGPGREASEDRGGFLRADAQWVVLLGVLSAVVTVLAYTGVSWPTVVHVLNDSAVASPSSSSGVIEPTQPVQVPVVPIASSAASSLASPSSPSPSPSPSLFSPAQRPDTPALEPSDFNHVATDPTKVSVATMLPWQYNDSGIVFGRTSGSVRPCPIGDETVGVQDTLGNYGCTSEVIGSYLDSSKQIQVSVWVIPLPDITNAEGADNALRSSGVGAWGLWCPTTGAGSQVCQRPWQTATKSYWTGSCHRYLMRAVALYVDLRSGSAFQTVLSSAADAALDAIGPQNIPVARCWPSSAGG